MRRSVVALVAFLFFGCAGWGRDHATRLRPDEDDLEPLTIRCDAAPPGEVASLRVPVVVQAPAGLQPVGELFDWRRRSEDAPPLPFVKRQHGLVVDADAFARTVQGDVDRIFAVERSGAGELAPPVVVRIVDVRTFMERPRLTAIRGRMVSRVVLGAELRRGDAVTWSRLFEGEAEKLVYYVRLAHHETTLSAAYCAALARLREAIPDITRVSSGF